jgi:ATP/maltotriose-dependent transcriptional regulator MalT
MARERLARYLWTCGRHADSAAEYARAVELMPPEPPSSERASVLGSLAQVLMLRGDLLESRGLAEQAIAIARQVGDRAVEAHALNTLGVDIASVGQRERGIGLLRESLAIELTLGASDNLQRTYTNLSDALDQDGQVEEGLELALEGVRVAREQGMTRGWAAFLLAEAANRCTRLGRLQDAQRMIDEALAFGATGLQGGFVNEMAARVAVMTGHYDAARTHVDEALRLLRLAAGAMWVAPLHARRVELAALEGDIAAARHAVADGQGSGENEYPFYARELYLSALRAEGDEAERARAARDVEAEREAVRNGEALATRMRDLATMSEDPQPQVAADLVRIDAELARIHGRPEPELWRRAAELNDAIGNRVGWADARLREAEALMQRGELAAEPLQAAHAAAAESGAVPLREECEALARRARVPLGEQRKAPEPTADDPFGLTPREREVLELVAAGRTNRQIGEELFMSEKTASVHVSRILAKLEVSTRGEAGAVAHRLGLD